MQYIEYIGKLFKGDIGYSIYYNDGVLSIILKRMVWTVSIVIIALILSFL